jgi:hypothetical protein
MKSIIISSVVFLLFFNVQSCNTIEPPDNSLQPGRRDYTWTADTLWATDWFGITDVWGSAPNSIWVTASGTSAKDCLWYYDGIKWTEYSQSLSSTLNTVFGAVPDEIWIGDSYGTIWRNKGNGWQKFQEITVAGYDRIIIASIYGTSQNNLYAVGSADNYDGSGYKGMILKYDGINWKLLNIPNLRVGFNHIKKLSDGNYIISATNFDTGFLDKLFIFDGTSNLKEIYSDYNWPGLYQMNGEVYVAINRKIYKCNNDSLEFWKEFPGTSYAGGVLGRSEKDFFCSGYDGILHYNGTDLANLYPTQNLELVGSLIFEKDIFYSGYDSEKQIEIMIRGTLK